MTKSILYDDWFLSILPKTKEILPREFDVIFKYLESLNLQYYTICETGCIRSLTQFDWQGNFTILANRFVEIHNGIVYTVNIDLEAINLCKSLLHVKATCADSVDYLNKLENIDSINFFYLDSMDINFDNPEPSIQHHYNEFLTIINRKNVGNFYLCIDDNINKKIQKGLKINNFLKKLNILPLLNGYQSLYWINLSDFNKIKANYTYPNGIVVSILPKL